MESFIAKLAIAIIPLFLFVTAVTLPDKRTRKSFIVFCRVRRAFITAASLRWF